jgi:hypothetical protein
LNGKKILPKNRRIEVLKLKLRNGKALIAFEMMPSYPILLRAK